MNKRVTKILCVAVSAAAAFGAAFTAGCSNYYDSEPLGGNIFQGTVESNGGFAVKKGEYLYFINGVEGYTASNDFGTPVKGAIYRISETNLKNHNYAKVDRVVPQVVYSGNYDAGIFIYGDYIYYATPSTERDASGAVQNSLLDLKSSKLDGTETLKAPYVQLTDNSSQYRFVEENGKVYILYVITEDSVTTLHSYNIEGETDTVLAYNVDKVVFDKTDVTNSRVYYTMNVKNYVDDSNYSYNQIYTVTASATQDKFAELDKTTIIGWDKEEDKYENCGDLVFDGRGKTDVKTPFNYDYDNIDRSEYKYEIQTYQGGMLFYTRTSQNNSSPYLFAFKDGDLSSAAVNPVTRNPEASKKIMAYSSSSDVKASGYTYIFKNGKLDFVLYTESGGGITINKAEYTGDDFTLQTKTSADEQNSKYYYIVDSREGTASIIYVDSQYVYYTLGSGTSINRIDYTGDLSNYLTNVLPASDSDYDPVKILDIQASSSWYTPEFIDGQLLFASSTTLMSAYNPIMACDIGGMSNKDIEDLNELYGGINDIIAETYGDEDAYPKATYANLTNALRYAFYTGEKRSEYLDDHAKLMNADVEEGGNPVYSDKTLQIYDEFLTPTADGVWKDYTAKKTVNEKEIYANRLEYYYCVLGVMSDEDQESYIESVRSSYLANKTAEEEEPGWWEGLTTAQKVWTVIAIVAIALAVAGGITVAVIFIVRHFRKKSPESRRKRIKVDLTDDKDIDVYGDGEPKESAEAGDGKSE